MQVVNCKVGASKGKTESTGIFALATMESPEDAAKCVLEIGLDDFKGYTLHAKKVSMFAFCW